MKIRGFLGGREERKLTFACPLLFTHTSTVQPPTTQQQKVILPPRPNNTPTVRLSYSQPTFTTSTQSKTLTNLLKRAKESAPNFVDKYLFGKNTCLCFPMCNRLHIYT